MALPAPVQQPYIIATGCVMAGDQRFFAMQVMGIRIPPHPMNHTHLIIPPLGPSFSVLSSITR